MLCNHHFHSHLHTCGKLKLFDFRLFGDFFNRVDSTDFNIEQNQSRFQNKFIELILQYCSGLVHFKLHRFRPVNQFKSLHLIAPHCSQLNSIFVSSVVKVRSMNFSSSLPCIAHIHFKKCFLWTPSSRSS